MGSPCRSMSRFAARRSRASAVPLGRPWRISSRALLAPGLELADKCWAESLLGELSTRLGDAAAAEAHFRSVLAACPSDSYVKGALADLLLDLQRNAEVASLLSDQVRQDALLLRLTIAERRLKSALFSTHLEDLKQRFEEAQLRGSSVHRREEARFELALLDAPEPALKLALENFQVQRETADVRIALEAALAAGHPESVARGSRLRARIGAGRWARGWPTSELSAMNRASAALLFALVLLVPALAGAHKPSDSYLMLERNGKRSPRALGHRAARFGARAGARCGPRWFAELGRAQGATARRHGLCGGAPERAHGCR